MIRRNIQETLVDLGLPPMYPQHPDQDVLERVKRMMETKEYGALRRALITKQITSDEYRERLARLLRATSNPTASSS